jgi:hypothetical protein
MLAEVSDEGEQAGARKRGRFPKEMWAEEEADG